MEWTELTPLSPDNLNDLENRIAAALDEVTAKKSIIAEAITDMGQSASSDDTFAELADKIRDISDDANAATGDVLNGKTFYQGGSKKIGTMPNIGGLTDAFNTAVDTPSGNGYLYARIELGAYITPSYMGKSQIRMYDPNHVSANIKDGVSLFGVVGILKENEIVEVLPGTNVIKTIDLSENIYYPPTMPTFTKLTDIATMTVPGTVRIGFNIGIPNENNSYNAVARIYKNDVAVGTIRTARFATEFYEDFEVETGDVLSLYYSVDTAALPIKVYWINVGVGNKMPIEM